MISDKIINTKLSVEELELKLKKVKNYVLSYNWDLIAMVVFIYFGGVIGLYYLITFQAKFYTYLWGE